ncbi:MAG TPA: hypothetical protein VN513_09290 [Gemmatimonadales bacterium]|nr:hypothetical protein [Gemmatimonadales bacterium]
MTPEQSPPRGRMYYLGPPLFGAAVLIAIVAVRIVFLLPAILRNPVLRAQIPMTLGAVAAAGFIAGTVYVALGRPARRIPIAGPYLAGIVVIAAYMGALLYAAPYISSDRLVKNRSDLVLYAVVTVFFGLVAGHSWFRNKSPSRTR